MQPDPGQTLVTAHPVGSRLKGKVMRIADFGAFVEVEPGIEGLVHISQLSEERVESVASVVNVGDEIEVQVLDINPRDRKASLSVRALTEVSPQEYTEQVAGAGELAHQPGRRAWREAAEVQEGVAEAALEN